MQKMLPETGTCCLLCIYWYKFVIIGQSGEAEKRSEETEFDKSAIERHYNSLHIADFGQNNSKNFSKQLFCIYPGLKDKFSENLNKIRRVAFTV